MTTRPNRWVLIAIKTRYETLYKVFATWSGGYLDGDSWRLNSGVRKVIPHAEEYEFQGFSGSTYLCSKDSYGIAGVNNYPVLQSLKNSAKSNKDFTVTILSEEEAMKYLGEGL